jgi:hypothetical protein
MSFAGGGSQSSTFSQSSPVVVGAVVDDTSNDEIVARVLADYENQHYDRMRTRGGDDDSDSTPLLSNYRGQDVASVAPVIAEPAYDSYQYSAWQSHSGRGNYGSYSSPASVRQHPGVVVTTREDLFDFYLFFCCCLLWFIIFLVLIAVISYEYYDDDYY